MKTLTTVFLLISGLISIGGEISGYYQQARDDAGQGTNRLVTFSDYLNNPQQVADIHAMMQKSRSNADVESTNHGVSEIGIERTGCLGQCPVYTFMAKSDGSFRYKGDNDAARKGEFRGTVQLYQFRQLAQFIRDSGYLELEYNYDRAVTCSPTVFTTVVMKGKRKVVRNYADAGPTKLWAIEQLIDNLMRDAQWSDAKSETNWTTLFNGSDLTGWKQVNNGTFYATNGVIHLEGGQGWLRTEKEYGDFILEAEWRGLEANYNSGILIRAPLHPMPWTTNGWQVNLKQTAVGELLEGARKAVLSKTTKPVGEWVKYRVEALGKNLTLFINGERAWEFNEFEAPRGYIGLQAEGKTVEFRNLRIQELPEK